MENIYLDIIRRANNTSYLYGDLIAPVSKISLENMRLSLADDYAFVDFSVAGLLTPYIGKKITIFDNAGKKAIGYIKTAGIGETYGNELVINGGFDSDTIGWTAYGGLGSLASIAGGQSGNCLEITKISGSTQVAYQNYSGLIVGKLYKFTFYVKSGTSGNEAYKAGIYTQTYDAIKMELTGTSSGGWVLISGIWECDTADITIAIVKNSATAGTMLFDTVSLKQVLTPSATGVTIVSTPGGSIYNWGSIESGFNYNDASGYTYEIDDLVCGNGHVYKCTTPGTSGSSPPVFNIGVGSTTEDGTVIWTECNPSGIYYSAALQFIRGPRYGDYKRKKQYIQPIDYSDGDDIYVYDKGLSARNTREITFQRMITADLTRLLEFIEIVRGAKFAFNFYDENGVEHKTLLINPDDITSAPVAYGMEGEITLELLFI